MLTITNVTNPKCSWFTSWFTQVCSLLQQYHLPHTLILLHNPPDKEAYKNLVKSNVLDYWETKLRSEAEFLPSLIYFYPQYMYQRLECRCCSLLHNIPVQSSPDTGPQKILRELAPFNHVKISTVLSHQNTFFSTVQPTAYSHTRQRNISLCLNIRGQVSHQLVTLLLLSNSSQKTMQFLLDCSAIPEVIHAAQIYGEKVYRDLFYLSRTWCFALHRERMKRLCKWNFS